MKRSDMKRIVLVALTLLGTAQATRYANNLALLQPSEVCIEKPSIFLDKTFDSTSALPAEIQQILKKEAARKGLNIAETTEENCVGFVYLTVNISKTIKGYIYNTRLQLTLQQAQLSQLTTPYMKTVYSEGKAMYAVVWDTEQLGIYEREDMLRPLMIGDGLNLFDAFVEDWKAVH
ncbi:hypothetical protein [Deinococcus roseus]|uniref:Uncharacterized protein n=1 Tax=Deinococcus roseus TaxID=392414 RepID=A0ABQ2CU08_9DEIO|nr:hypothetical protein [Deinococcus roseus]GGJ20822.1 hypothetical protein GCM10008938_03820 [Deinococcus roseus]